MKKVIFVRNKDGGYPSSWGPLVYANGRFYLGGSSTKIVIAKDSRDVKVIIRKIKEMMIKHNLQYMSKPIIDSNDAILGDKE